MKLEVKYNHQSAIRQMARELGCSKCIYHKPDSAIVCQRPDRTLSIRTHSQTGQCEEIVRR